MTTKTYEPVAPHDVAFLGLGVMGYPMAGHLAGAGHRVTVYNRTASVAEAFAQSTGARFATEPRRLAEHCDVVVLMPPLAISHGDLGRLVRIVAAAIEAAVESAYGGAEQPDR